MKWTNHRDGSFSAKVTMGNINTKARIEPRTTCDTTRYVPSLHGRCIKNPTPPALQPHQIDSDYEYESFETAEAAITALATPR